MKKINEFDNIEELSFSDAFFGTYKIDKKDGKPHLKEGFFHPFKDLWKIVFIFCGAVGSIMLPLMLSVHFQYFRNAKVNPTFYSAPTWQDYLVVASFGAAFIVDFIILLIPRVFFDKGAMLHCFIASVVVLNIGQVYSPFAMGLHVFSFTWDTLLKILWLIFSGCIETFLYGCGLCLYAAGLTALISYGIAKYRMWRFARYKANKYDE